MRIPNKLHHEIIPGILESQWETIAQKIEVVKPFAQTIHIDLLDGIFAPNKTWMDPKPFAAYTKDIAFELHMMVDNPLQYLRPFAEVGFTRFIGHVERMPDIAAFLADGENLGEVGLALDSGTLVEKLPATLDDLDFVFVMTVKVGFSRQSFMPEMLEKVKKIRTMDPLIPIEIDGGVNDSNIVSAKEAGATRFISTGFIFDAPYPTKQYQTLCSLIQ